MTGSQGVAGRRRRAAALVAALVVVAGCRDTGGSGGALERFEYAEGHLGTQVRMVLYAPGRGVADSAAAAAFGTVARLDSLFSDYRDDSGVAELARAAGEAARPVAPELAALLTASLDWSRRSGGAFDVTVGPVTRRWRRAMADGALPPATQRDSLAALVGWSDLHVNAAEGMARLGRAGMSLDLGGIAKGWIAQVVRDTLAERGLQAVLVDAGGDLVLGAPPPDAVGWRVEFPGGAVHTLSRVAVATSGDRYQFLEAGGVRYSHVIDPRTGVGIPGSPTVAVVALNGATADALASALTVLAGSAQTGSFPPESARRLVASLGDVAVHLVPATPGESAWHTPGFPALPSTPTP